MEFIENHIHYMSRVFPKEASEAMTLALNDDYERTERFSGIIDIPLNSPSKIDVN